METGEPNIPTVAAAVVGPPPRQTWTEFISSYANVLFPSWGGVPAAVEPVVVGAGEASAVPPVPRTRSEGIGGLFRRFVGGAATATVPSDRDIEPGEGRAALYNMQSNPQD